MINDVIEDYTPYQNAGGIFNNGSSSGEDEDVERLLSNESL